MFVGIKCTKVSDIKLVYAMGNIANMKDDEFKACLKKMGIKKINYANSTAVSQIIEECVHPPWSNYDLWKPLFQVLTKWNDTYHGHIKNLRNYIELRIDQNRSVANAELIRTYLIRRTQLIDRLFKEVSFFQSYHSNSTAAQT